MGRTGGNQQKLSRFQAAAGSAGLIVLLSIGYDVYFKSSVVMVLFCDLSGIVENR